MIHLWELGGQEDRRYSVFSWRTRWALRHKGLQFESHPILQIDKATIAFSGGTTVPVIRDNDIVVRDSWQIADYLESAYPQSPSLFGGAQGRALCFFFNQWTDRSVMPIAFSVLACDAIRIQDPADRAHFAATTARFTRSDAAELKIRQPENLERLARAVAPARAALRDQAFLGGAAPCYADYTIASVYQWARIVSPVDPLHDDAILRAWFDTMLDLHDGFARHTAAFR